MSIFRFLPFLLVSSLVFALEVPTSEQISAALDVEGQLAWELTLGEGSTAEVVNKEGAVGGTALKISIPMDSDASLRLGVEKASVFEVSLWPEHLTDLNAYVEFRYNRVLLNEDGFESLRFNKLKKQLLDSGFFHLQYWSRSSDEPDSVRVIYLDDVSVTDGYFTDVKGYGMDVSYSPNKNVYLEDELVRVEAVPSSVDNEFLFWSEDRSLEGYPYDRVSISKVQDIRGLVAYGARKYGFGDLDVLVPIGERESQLVENGEVLEIWGNDGEIFNDFYIRNKTSGSIEFEARWVTDETFSNVSIQGVDLTNEYKIITLVVDGSDTLLPLSISGNSDEDRIQIRNMVLNADEQFYSVTVEGNGSVSGLPSDGMIDSNALLNLVAIPDSGWAFGGWSGEFSVGDASISIDPRIVRSLGAWFYREETLAGISARLLEENSWVDDSGSGESAVVSPGEMAGYSKATVEWELEGPGVFSFDFSDWSGYADATILLNGQFYKELYQNAQNRSVEVPLSIGSSVVTVEFDNDSFSSSTQTEKLRLSNIKWQPGHRVDISSVGDGEVVGGDSIDGFVDYGTVLNLRATPNSGSRFIGWEGSSESKNEELSLVVKDSVRLRAIFEKESIGTGFIDSIKGGGWTWSSGVWTSPDDLESDELSQIEGSVVGPAKIVFDATIVSSEGGALKFGIEGVNTGYLRSGPNTYFVPEGTHRFYMGGSGFGQKVISNLRVEYLVKIEVKEGRLVSDPALSFDYNNGIYSGYIKEGDLFSFSPNPDVETIVAWSDSLAGLPVSGSLEVDGPIVSKGIHALAEYTFGDLIWSLEGFGESQLDNGLIIVDPSIEEGKARAELTGPGTFSVYHQGVESLVVKLDGELVSTTNTGSYYNYKIPEGDFSVELSFVLDSEYYGEFRDYNLQLGYSYGYSFYEYGAESNPGSGYHPAGTVINVSADSREFSEFVAWEEPFEDKGESFEFVLNEDVYVQAKFQASTEILGKTIEYEGEVPVFWGSSISGTGRWVFALPEGGGSSKMAMDVEGPGRLFLTRGYNWKIGESVVEVQIDGVTQNIDDIRNGYPLSAGVQRVSVSIVPPETYVPQDYVEISFPRIESEFRVWVSGTNATVENSNPKSEYEFGETLTLTAPTFNDNSVLFMGWSIYGQDTLLSEEEVLEWTVDGDVSLVARYGAKPLLVGVGQVDGADSWALNSSVLSPRNEETHFMPEGKYLTFEGSGPALVRFALKSSTAGAEYSLSRTGDSLNYTGKTGEEWSYVQVYLDGSDSLLLSLDRQSEWYLGDIEIVEGWEPTIIYEKIGSILTRSNGGKIELYAEDATRDGFLGWVGADKELLTDSVLSIDPGSKELVQPVFQTTVDSIHFGDVRIDSPSSWTRSADDGEVWESNESRSHLADRKFSFEIEGPKVLSFDVDSWWQAGRVEFGSDSIGALNVNWANNRSYVQIPKGVHRITVRPAETWDDDVVIEGVQILDGFYYEARSTEGGTVRPSEESNVFDEGVVIHFMAIADDGYEFESWDAPFDSEASVMEFVSGTTPEPEARFRKTTRQVEFSGYTWESEGLQVVERIETDSSSVSGKMRRIVSIKNFSYDDPGVMECVITGPAVLVTNYEANNVFVDGEPVHHSNLPRGTTTLVDTNGLNYRFGVPVGEHVVSIKPSSNYVFDLTDSVRILPGCLVTFEGLGAKFHFEPKLEAYPIGTKVKVKRPSFLSADQIELIGAPINRVSDVDGFSFEVTQHANIFGALFRQGYIMGLEIEYAGNSPWTERDYGGYETTAPPFGSRNIVRLKSNKKGMFSFRGFSNDSAKVAFSQASDNGDNIYERSFLFNFGNYFSVNSSDILQWEFNGVFNNSNGTPIVFDEFGYVESPEGSYLDWWLTHDPSNYWEPGTLDPNGDNDRDGLSNYVEYLIGGDPVVYQRYLKIVRNSDLESFSLSLDSALDPIAQYIDFQYKEGVYGWRTAEYLLGDYSVDPIEVGRSLIPIIEPLRVGEPLLFRFKFSENVPYLEVLLEN